MDKFFLLPLLSLLIIAYGVSCSIDPESDIDMVKELETFDTEEQDDNVVDTYAIPVWKSERGSRSLMNVDSFDAVGDGVTDDTMVVHKTFPFWKHDFGRDDTKPKCLFCYQAFRKAWETACSAAKSVLLVPKEKRYLVNATTFKGPCNDGMIIQVKHKII